MSSDRIRLAKPGGEPLRALVTGSTGYIGGRVVQALVQHGWEVHTLVRSPTDAIRPVFNATRHLIDQSYASISEAIQNVQADVTFHLASSVIVDHTPDQVKTLLESNILFPAYLVEAMSRNGLSRLINTGTSWEHFDSTDLYVPTNLYSATKKAFEELCAFYVSTGKLRMITLKLFDVYGPNDTRNKILPLLLKAIDRKTALKMSTGEQSLDMVFISDVVDAYLTAAYMLLDTESKTNFYTVRTGRLLTLRQIVAILETQIGTKAEIVWGGRPNREREVMVPWSSHRLLPRWQAQVTLEKGLDMVISAHRSSFIND